jgi:DNA primase
VRSVVLLLDGDAAGYQARERLVPLLAATFSVRAPVLPDGEKPDTLDEAQLRKLIVSPENC